MLVYLAQSVAIDPRPRLAALGRALDEAAAARLDVAAARELVIDYGELEAAVIDARAGERDDCDDVTRRWRRGAELVARQFCRALEGRPIAGLAAEAAALVGALARALPRRVALRPPEGYAHYGLYPEQYVDAAQAMARALGPACVVCVGLRSIGTSLSALVAGALAEAGVRSCSHTVRPRGAPFDRTLALAPRLEAALRPRGDDVWYAVVDEGPGLSGSSICAAAAALERLGAPAGRIVLVPSSDADPARFVSAAARARWPRHGRFVGRFEPRRLFAAPLCDWSAGAWRAHLPGAARVAVQPEHERRKYFDPAARALYKFAGLGRHGRARLARAEVLAAAGFALEPAALEHGFLRAAWVAGRPAAPGAVDGALLGTVARYLAFVARRFACDEPPAALGEMTATNVRALLGDGAAAALGPIERALGRPRAAAVLDGRLLAHEWIRTAAGWRKTDAVDHGDDHFFPGRPQDPAWDLAAAAVELALPPRAAAQLAAAYADAARDPDVARRLPAFTVAYLAFRGGYATLAAARLRGTPDGERFARARRRYVAALRRALVQARRA